MPEDSPPRDAPPPTDEPQEPTEPTNPKKSAASPSIRSRLLALARVPVLLAGLAVTVLGFVRFVDVFQEIHLYRTVPTCATPAARPGALCATVESGRVTEQWKEPGDGSTTYKLTVARETAPVRSYMVGQAFYEDVSPGTVVELKILRGKVLEVSYHGHRARALNFPWLKWIEFSVVIGAGVALVLAGGYLDELVQLVGMLAVTAAVTAVATAIGAAVLITVQWPLVISLAIGAALWLLAVYTGHRTIEES
ncbi:hypothetical protein ACIRVF_38315 [Kitasatospora sp. NPDC101157]|uniref:hypothetical protein n=1 Tax=Kitasatospora sp. NPDC101157 TaxID=3364098 RepID=UPI00381F615B